MLGNTYAVVLKVRQLVIDEPVLILLKLKYEYWIHVHKIEIHQC